MIRPVLYSYKKKIFLGYLERRMLRIRGNMSFIEVYISVQPSQYINTLLVPKDGEIPVDVQCLAAQGIFDVVCMPLTICFE